MSPRSYPSYHIHLGSWISVLGSRILDLGSWIVDLGFWILDLGFWILDIESWILDLGSWILCKMQHVNEHISTYNGKYEYMCKNNSKYNYKNDIIVKMRVVSFRTQIVCYA